MKFPWQVLTISLIQQLQFPGSVEKTRPGSRLSKIESRRFEHYCHLFTGPIVLGKTILLICHQEAALTNRMSICFTGPEWLKTAELHPIEVLPFQMPEECRPEMKVNKSEATHGLLSAVVPAGIEVMDCKRYSSVARLLAVTANVQKFFRLARPYSSLPAESDTAKAEILWILETQKDLVKDPKFAQWKRQFNLFQDDCSIWRSRGCIENADVSYSTKYPILLPRDHPFTALIVRRAHERVFHGGVKSTLTELRSQFWIVKGRSLIQQLLRSCVLCKQFEGRPYRHPPPPPLPLFRVDKAPPFTYTGVDFTGPLYLKGATTLPKVWIYLFTCCVTRAVHLDLVRDLSTSSFIRCLKKFVAYPPE